MATDPKRVKAIFLEAAELPDAAARAAHLDRSCGGDAGLRARVEALLRSHNPAGSFLGTPAAVIPEPDHAATRAFTPDADRAGTRTGGEADPSDDEPLTFLAPPTRPDSLGRIGHYEVLQVLGRGGFGIVFRAFDDVLHRVVAVKVLSPQMAATSPARKRFLREARASAAVRHEHVVQVYEVGEHPLPYLVMEYIPGETLKDRLDRTGPLDPREAVQLGRQIAQGLAAAHATGLIHRDIKPANILIDAGTNLSAKITDFGLARAADDASLTQSGMVAGTPMYMAPEQAGGGVLDHRADLFSLGSVLYTMLSGRPPFRADGTLAVLKRVAEDTPRPIRDLTPEAPRWLCDLIGRLHAKRREDRIGTAREVADLLGRGLAAMQHSGKAPALPEVAPVVAPAGRPEPVGVRPPRTGRRWAVAAAVLVLLVGGLGVAEATGITAVRGTVVRLFSPEGTLVVEVDDPAVSVQIDGSDVVITGAGAKEIRLKPGRYTVEARKDGQVVSRELVTVAKDGRQVVRVSQEPPAAPKPPAGGPPAASRPIPAEVAAWERGVAVLPAAVQVEAVAARLKELNPGFDGKFRPTIEDGAVTRVWFDSDQAKDIAPLRALRELKHLYSNAGVADLSPLGGLPLRSINLYGTDQLRDLSPLRGMPLETLEIFSHGATDLSPLRGARLTRLNFWTWPGADLSPLEGMPLKWVNIGQAGRDFDLTPLAGMPLEFLGVNHTHVSDLRPLRGMPLKDLACSHTRVSDLTPLRGLPLEVLSVSDSRVTDLSPLKGIKLKRLSINGTGVADLEPLRGMALEEVRLTPKTITHGLDILRDMTSLKKIGTGEADPQNWPAAEFWARYDRGEFK